MNWPAWVTPDDLTVGARWRRIAPGLESRLNHVRGVVDGLLAMRCWSKGKQRWIYNFIDPYDALSIYRPARYLDGFDDWREAPWPPEVT